MKIRKLVICMLGVGFCLVCNRHDPNTGKLSNQPKTIFLSHSQPADVSNEFHLAAWIFQKYIHDHSKNLTVKIFAANSLEAEHDVFKAIQRGNDLTCAISRTTALTSFCNKIDVLHLPFLWKNFEHVHQALDGEVGKILEKELARSGFKVLAWMDSWGFQNFLSVKRDIENFDKMTALKWQTSQSPKYTESMKILGIQTTSMAYSEIYPSLQSGKLDGIEQNAVSVLANKFAGAFQSMLLTRHLYIPVVFVFCQSEWEKFSEEEKSLITEAAHLASELECALAPWRDQAAQNFLIEQNITLHPIDVSGISKAITAVQDKQASESNALDLLQIIRSYKN